MGELEFDFQDKSKPLNYTIRMASKLQQFGEPDLLPDLIRHMYVVDQLDKERIQHMSDLLFNPKNLNIYLRSKNFDVSTQCTLEDPFYNTKYGREPFSEHLLGLMT